MFAARHILVLDIRLLHTIFQLGDGRALMVSHTELSHMQISNLRRSSVPLLPIRLMVAYNTPHEKVRALFGHLGAYLRANPLAWRPSARLRYEEVVIGSHVRLKLEITPLEDWQDISRIERALSKLLASLGESIVRIGITCVQMTTPIQLLNVPLARNAGWSANIDEHFDDGNNLKQDAARRENLNRDGVTGSVTTVNNERKHGAGFGWRG